MALVGHQQPQHCLERRGRGLAALSICLMLGACASVDGVGPSPLSLAESTPAAKGPSAKGDKEAKDRSELAKATEWWGRKYAENTRDLPAALNYARNLKAMGEKERALAVLQQAAIFHGESRELAGEYGRLALDLDQINVAGRLLALADDPVHPDWRVISARGTVFAKQSKYSEAIPFYERALSLAHDQPSIMSNLALAHAMNGEPAKAELMLRQAAAADPASLKIRQNLSLVLGLQGKYDEAKQVALVDLSAEKADENADYLRRVVKLDPQTAPKQDSSQIAVADSAERATPIAAQTAAHKVAADGGTWTIKIAPAHASKPGTKASAPAKAKPVAKVAATQPGQRPVAVERSAPKAAEVAASLKPGIIPPQNDWMTKVALTETGKK